MSFIRLSREPGFHYLAAHGFFDQSPTYDHLLEAQCVIDSVTSAGHTRLPLNVPLSDFASYPIGSVFGQTKARVKQNSTRRKTNRSILLDQGFEHWEADRSIEVKSRRPDGRWIMPLARPHSVLVNHEPSVRRLGIVHGEQFRFICSSMGLLLDTISMMSIASVDALESAFVEMAHSGIEGDGTLVITPYRAYQNVTATLQIALLMSEPSLALFLRAMFLDIRARIAIGEPAMPGIRHFNEPSTCTIESEVVKIVHEDGQHELVDLCDRIVADHRKPKFKDIVVRIRCSRADGQIEMIRDLMTLEEKARERVSSSTRIVRYPQSSRTATRLARFQTEFGRLFPAFAGIKVRFDREYAQPKSTQPVRRFEHKDFVAPLASVAPQGSGSTLPNVRSAPTETKEFERPLVSERFLAVSDEPGLMPLVAKLEVMTPLMRAFLEAAYYLYEDIAHDQLPAVELARGEELLFELPSSWGGFAAPDSEGRLRYIAAFPLLLDQGIVWAIEIMRRHPQEQFAMGLCAPTEHDDGLSFLGRLMRAVCERIGRKRDGDLPGTFPRADFDDVRIDTIRHNEARWDAETLSEVLRSRAHLLVSPYHSF